MPLKVCVIGAGISGLTCSYELQKAGCHVEVFESEAFVGGRMSTFSKNGLLFDRGANFLLQGYTTIRGYARELGIESDWRRITEGCHALFRGGKKYLFAIDYPHQLLRFGAVSMASRIKFLLFMINHRIATPKTDFFDLSSTPKEWDLMDAKSLLTKKISLEVSQFIGDPFARTMQFHDLSELSAAAALAFFSERAKDPSLFETTCLLQGMSEIPTAMAERLHVHTNNPILNVCRSKKGLVVKPAKGANLLFDAVVIATPAPITLSILKHPTKGQMEVLRKTAYAQTINVSFSIPLDQVTSVNSTYVPYSENNIISEFTPEARKGIKANGKTLVNVGLHEEATLILSKKKDTEVFSAVKKELLKFHPEIQFTPYLLYRWKYAMPKFSKGHITRVRNFMKSHQGENRIYFAGDYLNAPWTEGACRLGARVAKIILQREIKQPTWINKSPSGK